MIVKVHIQPGAKKNEIVGRHGNAVKIRLKAPPVDGKANDALIQFLSEFLGIAKSNIEIIRGDKSREKTISFNCDVILLNKLTDLLTY